MTKGLLLSLSIPPDWARIDSVRQAVGLSIAAVFGDAGLKDSLSMVSAELLENAVKYGTTGGARVELLLREEANRLVVMVTNEVEEGSGHSRALHDRIAWLRGFDDPSEAYVAALAIAFASANPDSDESGLGIARIAYEGGCDLECDTSSAGRVIVRASRPLDPNAGGAPA